MNNASEQNQLRFQLDAQLEEFRALKAEIVSNLEAGRQAVGLTLTAAGVLLAAVPYIVDRQATVVLLLAPLLFYSLAWVQLRYTLLTLDIGAYLRETLIPKLRQTIRNAGPAVAEKMTDVMEWEDREASLLRLRGILILPIAGANYGIPLLAAASSLGGFFVNQLTRMDEIGFIEWALLSLDALLLVFSAAWGIWVERQR